jgi:uncharacterized membrane protein
MKNYSSEKCVEGGKMNFLNKNRVSFTIILIQIIFASVFFLILPADSQIPSHWNIQGEVDSYVSKTVGLLMPIFINLIVLVGIKNFYRFSARYNQAKERFDKILPAFNQIIVFFIAIIHIYSLAYVKYDNILAQWDFTPILVGLLFISLGNLLPKVPSNFFIGIKTPWTLSSEKVWIKTHLVGGICFVISGILLIVSGSFLRLGNTSHIFKLSSILIVLYPVVHSFIMFKKLEK